MLTETDDFDPGSFELGCNGSRRCEENRPMSMPFKAYGAIDCDFGLAAIDRRVIDADDDRQSFRMRVQQKPLL
jgi:hypothetical protein